MISHRRRSVALRFRLFHTPGVHIARPLSAVLVVLVLLSGCALPRKTPPAAPTAASSLWALFSQREKAQDIYAGYHFKASLNSITPERKNRVLLDLWGNYQYPTRLDVYAGVGVHFALWRESDAGWLSYYPGQNTAYFGDVPVDPASASQQSFPFTLNELAYLWSGSVGRLVPEHFQNAIPSENGGFRYLFTHDGRITSLSLDARGFPTEIAGPRPTQWRLVISGWEEHAGVTAPDKLTLSMAPDARAIVRIKERSFRNTPWPLDALALEPPEDARYIRLQGFAPDANLICPSPEKQ